MAQKNWDDEVLRARAALVVAALRKSILTYRELGVAIGMEGVALRNQLPRVLEHLSTDCYEHGEPSLAALVVNATSGEPGKGWTGPWHSTVRAVFDFDWGCANSRRLTGVST